MSDDQGRSPDGPPTESAGQQPDIVTRLRAALMSALGLKPNGSARAEIEDAIAADEAAGATLTADERTMLRAILKLGDMRVEDVMIPRADIEAIDIESSLAEVIAIFRESGHSRMPAYRETLDDPVGMVHIRDLMAWIADRALSRAVATGAEEAELRFRRGRSLRQPGGFEARPPGPLRAAVDAGARAPETHAVEPHADGARHRRVWRHRRARLAGGPGRDHRRRDRGRARPRGGADGEAGRRRRLSSPTRAPSSTTRRR